MFSSPIGRGRFFFYSVLLTIAEAVAILFCIVTTVGLAGLVASKPGPGRESLALTSFVVLLVFVVMRANIARRRGRDADLSNWVTLSYILLTVIFAVLQALSLLVYDFDKGDTNVGLGMLGLALMVLWFRICLASPKGGSFDADAFLAREGFGSVPTREAEWARARQAPTTAMNATAPVTPGPRRMESPRTTGFGKRGLA